MSIQEEGNQRRGDGANPIRDAIAVFVSSGRRPTLKSIAEITGLGVTTVSRALKDAPDLAIGTKDKVQEVAHQIGYRPDRAGVRLRTGKTNVISLILNPHDEVTGYGTSVILGITQALQDTSMHLVVTPHFLSGDVMDPVRYVVETGAADGIIMSRTTPMDPRIRFLLEQRFPFVCHGRTELATPHPYVDFDNKAFAEIGAARLIERGRKRLGLIWPPNHLTFHHHMKRGFLNSLDGSGAEFINMPGLDLDTSPHAIREGLAALCKRGEAPDGLLCGGEISALAAMAGFRDAGLEIGRDVDVIAKQTSTIFEHIVPPIDTIAEDLTETGVQLGRALLRQLMNPDDETVMQSLQPPETRWRT